jgi:hypothetical protein
VADTRGIGRRVPAVALVHGEGNFVSIASSVAVPSLHQRNLRQYALEPHDAAHRAAFDAPLALQLESELDEQFDRGREVVNHDADVRHPSDRHVLDG